MLWQLSGCEGRWPWYSEMIEEFIPTSLLLLLLLSPPVRVGLTGEVDDCWEMPADSSSVSTAAVSR